VLQLIVQNPTKKEMDEYFKGIGMKRKKSGGFTVELIFHSWAVQSPTSKTYITDSL
jgi:hypothetical protein